MKKIGIIFAILFFTLVSYAQIEIYGLGTRWDDSFKEWTIYTLGETEDEDEEGELGLRWGMNDDWTEWDYRLGEESGAIKMKWNNDPSQWELRANGEIITMKTKWRGDITEWRISDGTIHITLKSKYRTTLEEWEIVEDNYGEFEMYTTREGDIRDWDIEDRLDEEISFPFKMAMIFIAAYNSTPKI